MIDHYSQAEILEVFIPKDQLSKIGKRRSKKNRQ